MLAASVRGVQPRLRNDGTISPQCLYEIIEMVESHERTRRHPMSQTLQPARVVPPGRILGNELKARGWTQRDLAAMMGRPVQAISAIVRGVQQITPETAIELSEALGTSPEFWMNLETNYRLFLVRSINSP
jgi:addiction module HigA family antidote